MINSGFQCCFCGEGIASDNRNPTEVIIATNWDKPKKSSVNKFFGAILAVLKKECMIPLAIIFF